MIRYQNDGTCQDDVSLTYLLRISVPLVLRQAVVSKRFRGCGGDQLFVRGL